MSANSVSPHSGTDTVEHCTHRGSRATRDIVMPRFRSRDLGGLFEAHEFGLTGVRRDERVHLEARQRRGACCSA
jgi:hypothetical protein